MTGPFGDVRCIVNDMINAATAGGEAIPSDDSLNGTGECPAPNPVLPSTMEAKNHNNLSKVTDLVE